MNRGLTKNNRVQNPHQVCNDQSARCNGSNQRIRSTLSEDPCCRPIFSATFSRVSRCDSSGQKRPRNGRVLSQRPETDLSQLTMRRRLRLALQGGGPCIELRCSDSEVVECPNVAQSGRAGGRRAGPLIGVMRPFPLVLRERNVPEGTNANKSLLQVHCVLFAVSTLISERPLHRSVRAAFPHTDPTSDIDGFPCALRRL